MENGAEELSQVAKQSKTQEGEVPTQLVDEESNELNDPSLAFPLARIKKLMQTASPHSIRSDSLNLVTQATELFIKDLVTKAFGYTQIAKRKTVNIDDLLEVVLAYSNLAFLQEAKIHSSEKMQVEELDN